MSEEIKKEESKLPIPLPKDKELSPAEIEVLKKEFMVKLEAANEDTDRKLERGVYTLLTQQPFVGHLVQQLARKKDLSLPTAGVAAIHGKYTLFLNPFFISELKDVEVTAILVHEIYHLLNEHLRRWEGLDKKMYNAAADMAINPFIPNLPSFDVEEAKQKLIESGLTEQEASKSLPKPDQNGRACSGLLPKNYNLPDDKSSEWYYDAIMNNEELKKKFKQKTVQINLSQGLSNLSKEEQEQLKQDIKDGKVEITVGNDTHDGWDKSEGQTPEVLDEELRRMIRESLEKSKNYGNLPKHLQQSVEAFLTTKVNWKTRLRAFFQRATHVFRVNSRKRSSRRYGVTFPGQKSELKLNLGVFIDTSGSIGKEEAELFAGEINRIYETGLADITILFGDTEVQKIEKMTKPLKINEFKTYGGGGTNATPWLISLDKEGVDAAVILSDGYFSYDLKAPKCMLLWALTQNGVKPEQFQKEVKFGRVIQLEVEKKDK